MRSWTLEEYKSDWVDLADTEYIRADLVAAKDAEIERLLALVDNRDDIIQGLMDENTALREGRQTPPEIKSLKEWRDANAEIERLRKALDQVLQVTGITREYKRIADIYRPNPHPWLKIPCINGNGGGFRLDINLADVAPELYAYLREKEANHGN